MTQVWPVFGEAPVPGWVSMIFSPEGVVMTGWARVGVAGRAAMAASASKASRRGSGRIFVAPREGGPPYHTARSDCPSCRCGPRAGNFVRIATERRYSHVRTMCGSAHAFRPACEMADDDLQPSLN